MSERLILRGGRVIDPANGIDEVRDVAVADGIIVPAEQLTDARVIDLAGLVVAPGFIDMHVHLRDPGQTHKEDIASGTRAAAAGGFSTVVAMPNTAPPIDSAERLAEVQDRIRQHAVVRVLQAAALSSAQQGQVPTDYAALKRQGTVMLTDDGHFADDSLLMLQAMRAAAAEGLVIADHCEDERLCAGGVLHYGAVARQMGLPGKVRSSEDVAVARDILLAMETGAHVHIQHVSSAGTVELLRFARNRGARVSAEVTPHHLSLTDSACIEYGTNAKMNPPLREESDRLALVAAVKDGTIEAIATDHAPHTDEEKAVPFANAPSGIVGLEAAVPVCLTQLYHRDGMPLSDLVARFTSGPRRILGIDAGTLSVGAAADITVLDINRKHTLQMAAFKSKSRNCPYDNWPCQGKAAAVMVAGRWVFIDTFLDFCQF
jgi:dihydroorotase